MTVGDDALVEAAEHLLMVSERVFAEGGIARQIADGTHAHLPDDRKVDLARSLSRCAEQVRSMREHAGHLLHVDDAQIHADGLSRAQPARLPLNRKERFYTGTVLPMLVASDDFAHLPRFLRLCGLEGISRSEVIGTTDEWAFFTEYGFAESVFTDEDRAAWPQAVQADTPDVVIAGSDWLLAVEAKMFHRPNAAALERQMGRQAVLVEHWTQRLQLDPSRVRHVLLLPQRLAARAGNLGADVVTWEHVLEVYADVGPPYWVRLLDLALTRQADLESKPSRKNADAMLTGSEIVEAHAAGTLAFAHVGRRGGRRGDAFTQDLASGRWRHTAYEVRLDPLDRNPNWFTIEEFLAATAQPGENG